MTWLVSRYSRCSSSWSGDVDVLRVSGMDGQTLARSVQRAVLRIAS